MLAEHSHRELPETARPGLAKANLRKADMRDYRVEVGAAITRARGIVGWSLKELAGKLDKDPRQIARWEEGHERPHMDALLALDDFRWPLTQCIAALDERNEVVTTIRRTA